MIRQNASLIDFNMTKKISSLKLTKDLVVSASDFSTYFSLFLSSSKGRDKFLAMFQYLCDFLCECARHSNIPSVRQQYKQKRIVSVEINYHLKQSISSARKVFRLLRFLDEIKGMSRILRGHKPFAFKAISILTYTASFCYYVSDNILWFLSVLAETRMIQLGGLEKKMKDNKNYFSLGRILLYLTILTYSIILRIRKNYIYRNKITLQENQEDKKIYSQKYIKGRRKLRFIILQMILSISRFLMLVKSLKLPGHKHFDPIFVSICGVISAALGLFKAIFQKKIVIKLKQKSEKQPQQNQLSNSRRT